MRLLSLVMSLACMPTAAHASAVVIWPVDPVIKADEKATALWLENKGAAPVTLQVRSFAWSQPNGEDRLDAQDVVIASPPIAEVAPGARQLIRIIRRAPGATAESAYRLLIDELPPLPAGSATTAPHARLSVQMRYSIPLFVHTGVATGVQLTARFDTGPGGRVLMIRNTGGTRARLTDLRLVSREREVILKAGLAGYVLPGATLSLPLPENGIGAVKVGVNGADQVLGPAA